MNSANTRQYSPEQEAVVRQFKARRPMLTAVADVMTKEIKELLNDKKFSAQVKQSVLTGEQFTLLVSNTSTQHPLVELSAQIILRIVVRSSEEISLVKDALNTHYQSVEEGWKSSGSQLTLKLLIPTQAKPDGYRERTDVPTQIQLSIVANASEQRLTTDGEIIPPLALIMKGGGIKGLAYVGALDLLRDQYDFNWFVGTSAGAITAILLAAGYTVEELEVILKEKDFKDFFDAKWYQLPTNLIFKKGLHPAKSFTDWLDTLLATKLNKREAATLGDIQALTGNRVTVYASRERKGSLTFDSMDNPETKAAYAARCSMSIPFIFTPASDQGVFAFDGGLQNNFPIQRVIESYGTIPFISLFLGRENFEPIKEKSIFLHVMNIILSQGEDEYVERHKDKTIIIDPRPISTLDFNITDIEKKYLLTCGKIGALNHLLKPEERFEHSEYTEEFLNKSSVKPQVEKLNEERISARSKRNILLTLVGVFVFIVLVYILILIFKSFISNFFQLGHFLWSKIVELYYFLSSLSLVKP